MELDDLKQSWQQSHIDKPKNTNVMELLQQRSYGPLVALKREYRKQMLVMLILPIFLFTSNLNDISRPLTSIMFWSYVAFCFGVVVFANYNYRLVSKMEEMTGVVRSNLELQVYILENRMRWLLIGLRITLIYFIILTEAIPYFQHYSILDKWHSLNPFIRFGVYAVLLFAQYYFGRKMIQRKFGIHINYLKQLLKEMD